MKMAAKEFFDRREAKENLNFLMLLKEYVLRYKRYQEAYVKAADSVLLRDLAIERNKALNGLLTELRQIKGLDVPSNARPWQANVEVQNNFVLQFFQVLSDPEVLKSIIG